MESDKKSFEEDHVNKESSDFLEYQHKKLEKVAEIIKEEERAAKLLEETEKASAVTKPKTTIVINSIVKHDKQPEKQAPVEEDYEVIDGLYIEPFESQTELVESLDANDEIPDDETTFQAIDEVIQAAQNDFASTAEADFSIDVSDYTLAPTEEVSQSSAELETHVDNTGQAEDDYPTVNEAFSTSDQASELNLVDGLAIDTDTSLETEDTLSYEDEDIPIIKDLVLNAEEDAEENAQDKPDAIVDFEAAEQATEAEAVMQSTELDYAQPKISKIGRLLLDLGKISRSDTKKILRTQKKHGLLFGDAALKLGLINDDDIQKVVAMQFNYHYLQAGQGNFSDDLVAAYAPFTKKVENYRALRSQLMMNWFKKGHRAIAIVGANSGEGVSYLAANLGVVFSQLGARTLIIEANMRSPRQKEIFNIRTHSGLSDMIVGKIGSEAIQEIESIPDLSVLHAGTVPPNPQELLGRTSFNILFKNLSDDYDVILIDTPPVVQSADAQSVIEMSEGAMLVSRLHQTKHTDVLEMRQLIEMTGASIVSAVMNDF